VRAVTSEATACESGCSAYESITSGMRATASTWRRLRNRRG
jgi:hypothetical protein